VAKEIHSHYRMFTKKIGKDKYRTFRVPDKELMQIQRRIVAFVLWPLEMSETAHGGVRGRSAATNAAVHCGQRCVINLDVRTFFDKVRHGAVYRMFCHERHFGRDVAHLLTRLTTYQSLLPQGAPTSPVVANLVLAISVDAPASSSAQLLALNYTRFVDDLTFSGNNPRPIINAVARLLSSRRLPLYRKKNKKKSKLRITPHSRAQEVTGLLVNDAGRVSISRERRSAVRAAIFNLRSLTDQRATQKALRSIQGRINHVGQFNPGEARRLRRYLLSFGLDP
jgi:RNA-directed DNA polymerase